MVQLAGLLREITPSWMVPRSRRRRADRRADVGKIPPIIEARNADEAWRESVEKGLYGADTPDFSAVPETPGAVPLKSAS